MTRRRGPSTTRVARGPPPHRCATGRIILLRGDDLDRFLVQRMRQAAQHFLRADLPEAAAPAVPVGEDLGRPFADRKRVVSGQSVSVRVDLGGCCILKKKNKKYKKSRSGKNY